jgi:hypothetical protein
MNMKPGEPIAVANGPDGRGTVSESSALEAGVGSGITRRSDRTSWRGASIVRPRAVPAPRRFIKLNFFVLLPTSLGAQSQLSCAWRSTARCLTTILPRLVNTCERCFYIVEMTGFIW